MDESLLREMAEMEENHWWFRGRRTIVADLLGKILPRRENLILGDFGCGTGHMLSILERFGTTYAMDKSPLAVKFASRKAETRIGEGQVPDRIPFPERFFDAIVLLDVLEHIENDREALTELSRYLKPDGIVLLTVPSGPSLYTSRDRFHGHFKRYTRDMLRNFLAGAGFLVMYLSHYNTFFFPLAAAVRLIRRWRGTDQEGPDLSLPPHPVNRTRKTIFAAERFWISRGGTFPFGLSLIAVGRGKPG
jgi:SAM-dependent methyltransferase